MQWLEGAFVRVQTWENPRPSLGSFGNTTEVGSEPSNCHEEVEEKMERQQGLLDPIDKKLICVVEVLKHIMCLSACAVLDLPAARAQHKV